MDDCEWFEPQSENIRLGPKIAPVVAPRLGILCGCMPSWDSRPRLLLAVAPRLGILCGVAQDLLSLHRVIPRLMREHTGGDIRA